MNLAIPTIPGLKEVQSFNSLLGLSRPNYIPGLKEVQSFNSLLGLSRPNYIPRLKEVQSFNSLLGLSRPNYIPGLKEVQSFNSLLGSNSPTSKKNFYVFKIKIFWMTKWIKKRNLPQQLFQILLGIGTVLGQILRVENKLPLAIRLNIVLRNCNHFESDLFLNNISIFYFKISFFYSS